MFNRQELFASCVNLPLVCVYCCCCWMQFIYQANQCNCVRANKKADCDNREQDNSTNDCLTKTDYYNINMHAGVNWSPGWCMKVVPVSEIQGNRKKYNCWDSNDDKKRIKTSSIDNMKLPTKCNELFPPRAKRNPEDIAAVIEKNVKDFFTQKNLWMKKLKSLYDEKTGFKRLEEMTPQVHKNST